MTANSYDDDIVAGTLNVTADPTDHGNRSTFVVHQCEYVRIWWLQGFKDGPHGPSAFETPMQQCTYQFLCMKMNTIKH